MKILVFMFYIIFVAFAIIGWVMNIIQVFNANFNEINGELVLRVIGVFIAPIGAVMGYI